MSEFYHPYYGYRITSSSHFIISAFCHSRILLVSFYHPRFVIRILLSAFCHARFVMRILSRAFCHAHFVMRIWSCAFGHAHFVIRILSSSFSHHHFIVRHPPSTIRSSVYRDPVTIFWDNIQLILKISMLSTSRNIWNFIYCLNNILKTNNISMCSFSP